MKTVFWGAGGGETVIVGGILPFQVQSVKNKISTHLEKQREVVLVLRGSAAIGRILQVQV